jgi:hypothetical protein
MQPCIGLRRRAFLFATLGFGGSLACSSGRGSSVETGRQSKPVPVTLVEFDDSGTRKRIVTVEKVVKTSTEWKKQLTPPRVSFLGRVLQLP